MNSKIFFSSLALISLIFSSCNSSSDESVSIEDVSTISNDDTTDIISVDNATDNTLLEDNTSVILDDNTTTISLTGYLADSGIEGMIYKTSDGFSGTTKLNGAFNCKEGTTVTFFLGKTQMGNAVSCSSEPITPVTLFNATEDNYQDNPEVVNALRLLQSLDSDEIHSNGITIDEETMSKLDNETINFNEENSIENVLLEVAPDRTLIDEMDAVLNFEDTLSAINANVFITPSVKVSFFNSYSSDYFTLQRSIVDEDTKAVEGSIKAATSAFQATVSSISAVLDKKDTIVITDAMKTSMKDLLFPMVMITLNLQPQDEAVAKLLTDATVDLILLKDLKQADIDAAALNVTKVFIANSATLLGYTFTSEENAPVVASAIGTILMTYDNVAALASGNVVDATTTLVTNGINMTASLASTTALIINTNSFITTNGSLLIAQVYLELYYRNGETNLDVINAINDDSLWNNDITELSESADYDLILSRIGEGYFLTVNDHPWYYLSSENDYDMDEVKDIIDDFKYRFELEYENMNATMPAPSKLDQIVGNYSFEGDVNDSSGRGNNFDDNINVSYDYIAETNSQAVDISYRKLSTGSLGEGDFSEGMTLSLWIKTNLLDQRAIPFAIFPESITSSNVSELGIDLYYPSHSGWKFALSLSSEDGNHYEIYPSNEAPVEIGEWYHIVYTVNPQGIVRVWYNGVEGLGATIESPNFLKWNLSDYKLQIGSLFDGVDFDGEIDELKIYNTVLNDEDIEDL